MTGLILNGKAVCCMHMGNFDEAEMLLLEALNKASSFSKLVIILFLHIYYHRKTGFLLSILGMQLHVDMTAQMNLYNNPHFMISLHQKII